MHHSIKTVHALANWFNENLLDAELTESYTLSKDELCMVWVKQNQVYSIRLVTRWKQLLMFFGNNLLPKESNMQPVFSEIIGSKVIAVFLHKEDRSFFMLFNTGYKLHFKLYGPLANLLLSKDDTVVSVFRSNIVSDLKFDVSRWVPVTIPVLSEQVYAIVKGEELEIPRFVMLPNQKQENILYQSEDIADVYTQFSRLLFGYFQFREDKSKLLLEFNKQEKRLKAILQKSVIALDVLTHERSLEEIGHLIMANIHLIQKDDQQIELDDFYTGKSIIVKLNKELSPQENAAFYYRKFKHRKVELSELHKRIAQTEIKWKEIHLQINAIESVNSLKELKPFLKEKSKSEALKSPFLKFEKDGYLIWVGKNAANNDLLTQQYAGKNDIWLHAKGVSGSHVVIRKNKNKEVPDTVIKKAAEIAAYYSKAKGSQWVSVSFTFKKFVRKPKGADPGQVIMDKEEVILVHPHL